MSGHYHTHPWAQRPNRTAKRKPEPAVKPVECGEPKKGGGFCRHAKGRCALHGETDRRRRATEFT